MYSRFARLLMLALFVALLVSACAKNVGAPQAIERYIQALAAKNQDQMINLSCASWEEAALTELDAFLAVGTKVEGLKCQETGKEGENGFVECQGKIVADYGGEIQELDLAGNSYRAAFEDGEWRMCGYK